MNNRKAYIPYEALSGLNPPFSPASSPTAPWLSTQTTPGFLHFLLLVRLFPLHFCFVQLVLLLLWYNPHTIKFILLKCTIEWCLVYLQSYTTITTNFRAFITPKRNTVPLSSHSSPSPPPAPGNHSSTFYLCGFTYYRFFIECSHTLSGLVCLAPFT